MMGNLILLGEPIGPEPPDPEAIEIERRWRHRGSVPVDQDVRIAAESLYATMLRLGRNASVEEWTERYRLDWKLLRRPSPEFIEEAAMAHLVDGLRVVRADGNQKYQTIADESGRTRRTIADPDVQRTHEGAP